MMKSLLLTPLMIASAFAQQPNDPAAPGQKVIAEAFGKLTAELTAAIAKDGTAKAIDVCSVRAPQIATEVGKTHEVTLRRATTKPRNPKSAANDSEQAILTAFGLALTAKEAPKPQTVANPDGSTTFYAPIVIANPLCLQCHGTPEKDIARATLEAIQKHYPKDQATGYQLGDLRGLWSVTFPANK